jgi:hypothetical protein
MLMIVIFSLSKSIYFLVAFSPFAQTGIPSVLSRYSVRKIVIPTGFPIIRYISLSGQ